MMKLIHSHIHNAFPHHPALTLPIAYLVGLLCTLLELGAGGLSLGAIPWAAVRTDGPLSRSLVKVDCNSHV